ncbi:hypothetical protein CEK71_10115 [Methylovulum psychrotolerans]|uniref:DUF1874 domain-containing protein n=2 Tax=Methylovulum psychrotolerans TaxID=1704499 RepID=A0A1Z4BYR4_9GAMM|nr:hypothetical protein CEK71_10115 [Methylovulum psychrotolerans]
MCAQKPLTYIINSPILTNYGIWSFDGPLSVEAAKTFLADSFISAVGHTATAQFLSQLLGISISANRVQITLAPGDRALVLCLKTRLQEGRVLNAEEMAVIPYEIGLITRRQ